MEASQEKVVYRWARKEDWHPMMEMIWMTFLKFVGKDYSQKGILNFSRFITDLGLYEAFLDGRYLVMVASDGEKIVGAATVRDGNMLSLLFVEEESQHKGVGGKLLDKLCNYLKMHEGQETMRLRAVPDAVMFYQKKGFAVAGKMEGEDSIVVIPMIKRL